LKYFICLSLFVFCFAFFSCSGSNTGDAQDNKETTLPFAKLLQLFQSEATVLTLTPEEYVSWVYEQNGITYSSATNDQFDLKLIFYPPLLQAYKSAFTNNENPKDGHVNYVKIQQGYYYCDVECLIKYESASDPIKKTDLLNLLKQQLTVVKNSTDTLSNVIVEPFPSQVMNQPNKLLIMIPDADSLSNYKIILDGSPLHLKDVQLNLSSADIKSFPLIKL